MIISERISSLSASPIRKLNPYAAAAKAAGKKVYHLNIGQPDIETPAGFLDAIRRFDKKIIAYGDSHGNPRLLEAIRAYYQSWNMDYDIGQITITNGGSEALLIAMMALCDPGDEILVFEPFYANYNALARALNITVRAITTHAENGYALPDEAHVERGITPRTKAILLTNPGNPTGRVYTPAEMELISRVVRRHNLALIADEVYREFVYEASYRSFGAMPELDEHLVLVDSLSKRYSACGARIGAAALYATPKSYLDGVNAEYRRRRDTLRRELAKIPDVVCSLPQGAFYVMIKMPIDDAERFAIWLLEHFDSHGETVMFAPGSGFYATPGLGADEARLAYVLNCADLTRAIAILGEGLKAYPGTRLLA